MVRQSGNQGVVVSRQAKMIVHKKKGSFILVNFATEYGHLSEAQLVFPKGKSPIGANYWNSLNGVFISRESKFDWKRVNPYKNYRTQPKRLRGKGTAFAWQIKFIILPIAREKTLYSEGFRTRERMTHFDGFQSFILEAQETNDNHVALSPTSGNN